MQNEHNLVEFLLSRVSGTEQHLHDPRLCFPSQRKTCRPHRTNCSPASFVSERVCVCVWGHVRHDERRVCGERPLLDAPEKLRPLPPSPESPRLRRTGTGETSFDFLTFETLSRSVWLKLRRRRFQRPLRGSTGSPTNQRKPPRSMKGAHCCI